MPRALKPCGTVAAYRRHLRNGEPACDECLQAVADDKAQRRTVEAAKVAEVVQLTVVKNAEEENADPADGVDALADARQNLAIIRAAMTTAGPSSIAALSKRRDELIDRIQRLESRNKAKGGGLLDQLAQRRAERLAASTH